jgi:hypothetical protein
LNKARQSTETDRSKPHQGFALSIFCSHSHLVHRATFRRRGSWRPRPPRT